MRIEFTGHKDGLEVRYTTDDGRALHFTCDDFMSRRHHGFWNSRLLSFRGFEEMFSDGTPIASYEGWN